MLTNLTIVAQDFKEAHRSVFLGARFLRGGFVEERRGTLVPEIRVTTSPTALPAQGTMFAARRFRQFDCPMREPDTASELAPQATRPPNARTAIAPAPKSRRVTDR